MSLTKVSTWFYFPGAVMTDWLKWLLGGGTVQGLENVPASGAYIVVSNHTSNLDPPFVGAAIGRHTGRPIHFMAKQEIFHWPLIGWLARGSGVFFVRRGEGDRAAQRIALRAPGRRPPDRHLPGGDPLPRWHPERGEARGGAAGDAERRDARPGGDQRQRQRSSRDAAGGRHRTRVDIRVGKPFSLPHQPEGRLDREAMEQGTERIMREIAALLPEWQRGRYRSGPIESGE